MVATGPKNNQNYDYDITVIVDNSVENGDYSLIMTQKPVNEGKKEDENSSIGIAFILERNRNRDGQYRKNLRQIV